MSSKNLQPVRLPLKPIISRMKKVLEVKSDGAVAAALGIDPNKLYVWKKRDYIPYELLVSFASIMGLNLDWLLTGEGPMLRGGKEQPLTVCEETAIYKDAELSEIIEWLRANPKDKKLVLKLVKVKKDVGEAFEGLEFKIILKEEG